MSEEHNYVQILKQLIFSYFVNIVVFVIAPFGTVILSRGLSVSEFGVYSLFFIFWNLCMHFFAFGFNVFIVNYLPGRSSSEQKTVVGSIFSMYLFIFPVIIILWHFFLARIVLSWLNILSYSNESIWILFTIFVSVLAIIVYALLLVLQRLNFATFLYGLNSTFWIFASGIEFVIFRSVSLVHVFVYWFSGACFQLILSLANLGSKSKFLLVWPFKREICKDVLFRGLCFGLPLLPMILNQWTLTAVDRFLLSHYVGQEAVGFYSLVYAIVGIVFSLGSLIAGIFYPYVAKAHNLQNKKEYVLLLNASLKYTLFVVIPGIVGVFVLREEIITLMASAKFLVAAPLVKYLMWFPLLASLLLLFQMALLVHNKSFRVGLIYFCGVVFNYVLNVNLIPLFGVSGAAITTLITYSVMTAFMIFLSRHLFILNWQFLKLKRIIFAAVLMGLSLSILQPDTAFSKLLTIMLGAVIYFVLIILFKFFGKEEFVVLKSLFVHPIFQKVLNFVGPWV